MCARCHSPRPLTTHQRKLFLVAERLSWSHKVVSRRERERNEEALWAVNAELGILDPVIDDEDLVEGGRLSRGNEWHPYGSSGEAEAVMSLVSKAETLTGRSFGLWR